MLSSAGRFRFFVFTCRNAKSDFRLPLVNALRRDYETYYIWLKRRPVLSGPHESDAPKEMSLKQLLLWLWRFKRDDKLPVYFNSTNVSFPYVTAFLRLIAQRGIWCLDIHDDLLYHYTGLRRWREAFGITVMRLFSDVTVHAAPTLAELFPDSQHLGNASDLHPLTRNGEQAGVLIMASFDDRFDFNLFEHVAKSQPQVPFDLYGQMYEDDDGTIRRRIEALVAQLPNVTYHGAYMSDDLPRILGAYSITFAPYRTNVRLTRYIDPLRFYHCLNSGMEIITTAIPQAVYMQHAVHIVQDAAGFAEALDGIRQGRLKKQGAYTVINWQQRAERLVKILNSLPRTKKLLQRSESKTHG